MVGTSTRTQPGELDKSWYDSLELWIRVDSDRDEVTDDHMPIGLVISAHGTKKSLYSTRVDLGGQQRAFLPVRFPVKPMI